MRAGIGIDRLVVCLSEYLPLRIVYRISSMSMIAVYFSFQIVVVVTMKSIDMYNVHDSSLVVCFSNISAYFA